MNRVLGWHTWVGETGLRLFLLHVYWIGHTLLGGVVLGIFPATAAVHAVIRRDLMAAREGGSGDPRGSLREEFHRAWKQEFRQANTLGYTFVVMWALLLLDRRVLDSVDLGVGAPVLAGLLWLLTGFVFCMTAHVGALSAHFSEGVFALVRRSAVFVLARPLQAGLNAVIVAVVLCVYYVVPGLVPVFGLVVPTYLSFVYIWSTSVLPHGARTEQADSSRARVLVG